MGAPGPGGVGTGQPGAPAKPWGRKGNHPGRSAFHHPSIVKIHPWLTEVLVVGVKSALLNRIRISGSFKHPNARPLGIWEGLLLRIGELGGSQRFLAFSPDLIQGWDNEPFTGPWARILSGDLTCVLAFAIH